MSEIINNGYNRGASYSRNLEQTKLTNAHEEAKQKNQQTFELENKTKEPLS